MADNTTLLNNAVKSAGDIDLQDVTIITNNSGEFSLLGGYIGELNLFEDMYSTTLYGNLLVLDANNINQVIRLQGDEFIRIKMVTPSMLGAEIYKTFKIYSVTDRMLYTDTGKQSYILHFVSPEIFLDALQPIFKTYNGSAASIVKQIFDKKLSTPRNILADGSSTAPTPLSIVGDSVNQLKFTSPGWKPSRCINWIASKVQESGYKNPGYMFYETNKQFYFINVEHLIDGYKNAGQVYQDYYYVPQNLNSTTNNDENAYNPTLVKDIDKEYQKVVDFKVIETYNSLKNTQTGYLANRLYTFDVVTKQHETFSYDHVSNFKDYIHLEDIVGGYNPAAPFPAGVALRTDTGYQQVAFKHSQLYTGISNNANDVVQNVQTRRTSTQAELTNFQIEITVPGRTDIEVGSVVHFHYPDTTPRDASDTAKLKDDNYYSGFYLITAIRHKITHIKHMMVLEISKDSVSQAQ